MVQRKMLKTLNDEGSDTRVRERELMHVSEKIDSAPGFDRTCHIAVSKMPWRCAPLLKHGQIRCWGVFGFRPANSSYGQITGTLTIVSF
jgi:hypothetical protein